jgi:hypothetical protein
MNLRVSTGLLERSLRSWQTDEQVVASSNDMSETDLAELLAQTYIQTIVGVPEAYLNVCGACR